MCVFIFLVTLFRRSYWCVFAWSDIIVLHKGADV